MEAQISWITIYGSIFLRYLLFAGIPFLLFYVFFNDKWTLARIQKRFPRKKDYIREVSYSLSSVGIFAAIAWLLFAGPLGPYTQLYFESSEHSLLYYGFTIIVMMFIHDTYFYWMHRLMHHPKLFNMTHLVHHKSHNPSPWAAYSFHPLEAIVEASVLIVIAFVIPVHPTAMMLFFMFSIAYNVLGHLGYELYPKGTNKHWLGKWLNTSTNHNMHHKYSHGNYGLYFTFWDRLMGTMHKKYDRTFEEVTERRDGKKETSKNTRETGGPARLETI